MNAIDPTTPRNRAIAFHNQALSLPDRDPQLAYRLLSSAAVVDPTLPEAWYALGNADADLGLLPGAAAAFRKALGCADISPDLRVKVLVNLGHRLYHSGRLREAREACEAALALDPGQAFAWTNLSMVSCIEGTGTAVAEARRGWELSREPLTEMGLAFALLFDGQMREGLERFEARFPYKLSSYLSFPYPRWNGGRVDRLAVIAEQGMGDTLCYARFLAAARERCGSLVAMVQKELIPLLRGAVDGVELVHLEDALPVADAWCPVVSLPVALGLSDAEIIGAQGLRLSAVAREFPRWKAEGSFAVGIAWAGSSGNDIDRWRSCGIEPFLELYRVPGVQLYGLQVGERAKDLHSAGCAALVRDLSPHIRDASDTVALIRELDLVVSVESFLPHLCAAAGVECWVPLSMMGGDYRAGRRGAVPQMWAPRTRLFRQDSVGDWRRVFDRIVEALRGRPAQP